jgi:hypothetical protein
MPQMTVILRTNTRIRRLGLTLLCGWMLAGSLSFANAAEPGAAAAALRARYATLTEQLSRNQFQRPIYLESSESPNDSKGDIYALVAHPFAEVAAALKAPANWCEVMILHINTKHCRAATDAAGTSLAVSIGTKHNQPLAEASRVLFAYQLAAATPEYFEVRLSAKDGPMGTRDYRIVLEAIAIDAGKTLIHLSYAYAYGLPGRLAMQAYLATAGRGKVGFTITGNQPDGQPEYLGGARGVVERNTMRYYLAIDAYLASLDAPAGGQFEKRLRDWYAASERYARQLHEVDGPTYLAMKRSEYLRQQIVQ